jgi:hypothetical protein
MPPPDPLTRLGLARSPAMKLLRPTQEQMNDISMPESFRNFVIEQQGIQGNQDAIQRAALQEQNALVAEQAAQDYFSQPVTARERFLSDNPQAYASSAGPGIYREQMMQMRQPSLADRTLAPTLSRKLPVTARGDFQRLIDEGTPVLEAYDRAEVMEYNRGQRAKLAEFYSPEEVKAKFGSDEAPIGDDAVQYAIRERKAGGGSTLGTLKAYADFAAERLKRFAPEGFAPDPSDTVNYPKYEAALKDVEEAEAAYLNALRGAGGIRRQEQVAPAQEAPVPVPAGGAAPATSFRDTMKGAQPQAKDILKVDDAEILKDFEDPAADETTFMAAIEDPNASFEVKKKAAERLRQIADKPKKDPSLSRREVDDRKSRLMEMASQAEKQVRMYPEIQKYRKAWADEKAKVEGWIGEYADYMGYDPDNLRVSLARDEVIIPDPENPVTERGEFEKFIKEKYGDVLSKPAERLEPFKTREFAKELGMVPSVSSILKTPAPLLLLSPRFAGSSKSYGDVLDAYLEEVKNPATPETSVAPKPAAKNIKSITPISNPAPQ